jgi:uncharacterized protein
MTLRKVLLKQGIYFFLFNTFIVLLIASRYFKYISGIDNFLTLFYIFATTVTHFAALSLLLYIVYLPFILIFPNKKFAFTLSALLATLGCSMLIIDTFVYDLYRMHINSFVLELVFGGAGGQIFEFHFKQYLIAIGGSILFFAFMLLFSFLFFRWKKITEIKRNWLIPSIIGVLMFSGHFIHAWADAANYTPITKSSRYYPLYFPTTAKRMMLNLGLVDSIGYRDNLLVDNSVGGKDLNYPQTPLKFDKFERKNVIFILLDSWYYKSFDSIVTPNLYRFSKKCELYKKHYSGSNGTRTGIFSLFYSMPGTYWDMVLASKTGPCFIDVLQANNYLMKIFPSAPLISPPFDRTVFRKVKNLNIETKGKTASDRDIQITKDWLGFTKDYSSRKDTQSVFGFIFYDALHAISHPKNFKGPFQPAWEYPRYEDLNNNTDPTPFLNLYKNTAFFIDSLVGLVLSDLESKGFLKNSIVVISADHGQEFNDNKKNYWGHNGNYTAAQLQVPLFIYKPSGTHKEYNHWTSHYDIVPTILSDIFKCKNPIIDYSIGKHLNDTVGRDCLIVGSSDNFAILEPNRINSVHFSGTFDITDPKLNDIKDVKLNTTLINKALMNSKVFYKK